MVTNRSKRLIYEVRESWRKCKENGVSIFSIEKGDMISRNINLSVDSGPNKRRPQNNLPKLLQNDKYLEYMPLVMSLLVGNE